MKIGKATAFLPVSFFRENTQLLVQKSYSFFPGLPGGKAGSFFHFPTFPAKS